MDFYSYSTADKDTLTAITNHQESDSNSGLILRAASTKNNASRSIKFFSTSQAITFSDGLTTTVTVAARTAAKAAANPSKNSSQSTVNAVNADGAAPGFAFDATVPGTIYVVCSANNNRLRVGDGTTAPSSEVSGGTYKELATGIYEYKCAITAGSAFFYNTNGSIDVYAIRFVPTPSVTCKWNFDQYFAVESNVLGTSGTSAINLDGLYIHNNQGHTYLSRMTDDLMSLHAAGTSNTVSSTSASASVQADGFAFDAPCAGAFTFRVKPNSNDETKLNVYKDGTLDETYPMTIAANSNTVQNVTYTCTSAGTLYFIPSVNSYDFVSASFVPTTAGASQYKYVTIGSAGKATFCAAQNYTIPSGLTAYYVSAVDTENKTAKMAQITSGVIPACTGVILYGDAGTYELTSSESATAIGTNYLVANLANYTLPASGTYNSETQYAYTLSADGFKHSSGSGTLAAGKAFLRTTLNVEGAGARGITMVFDDGESTAIETINREPSTENHQYSLSGQRVDGSYKGLVIKNGKKYLVR